MYSTNTTADLSTCNSTFAILGQLKACPDCDDNDQTRPVTTTFARPSHIMHTMFVLVELARDAFEDSLTYTSYNVVLL